MHSMIHSQDSCSTASPPSYHISTPPSASDARSRKHCSITERAHDGDHSVHCLSEAAPVAGAPSWLMSWHRHAGTKTSACARNAQRRNQSHNGLRCMGTIEDKRNCTLMRTLMHCVIHAEQANELYSPCAVSRRSHVSQGAMRIFPMLT